MEKAQAESTINRNRYIEEQITMLTHYWIGTILFLGSALFLFLGVLDYFAAGSKFSHFLMLRVGISSFLLAEVIALKSLDKKGQRRNLQYFIILLGTFLSAVTIEVMILQLGGDSSVYYAGLSLLVVCVLGFVPLNMTASVLSVSVIYLTYILPLLLFHEISDPARFGANNAFLVSTVIIALVWRRLNQNNLVKMLGLQYDLDADRDKLAAYSLDLERLVEERTHALNESELMFRSLFENATDAIMLLDTEGKILNVNSRACELYGMERGSLTGTNVVLLEASENRNQFKKRLQRVLSGETLLYEAEHFKKSGEMITLEVSSRAIQINSSVLIQCFYRDMTEKKRLQKQLMQSQKMESIGQLAGGIAHDFNNILNAILGNVELIARAEEISGGLLEKIRRIETAGRKGARMVSKLLSFARRSSIEPVVFDLNEAVSSTLDLLDRLIPSKVRIEKDLKAELPSVKGDLNQMEQVVMNLVLNAKDAMPEGGMLHIATNRVRLENHNLDIDATVEPGEYVKLTVRDTGAGIEEADLPHIFEPFYSTKEKSKGMGLGLAMVYGIVKGHKGYITVKSKSGLGTVFEIYIPAAPEFAPPKNELADTGPLTGGETVLVIDDETAVLEFMSETLSTAGFSVLSSDSPVKGIHIYKEKWREIDLVVTDIVMPWMDGVELSKEIKEINPEAKIMWVTGFNEYGDETGADALLRKPVDNGNLLRTVREVLDLQGTGK